MPDLIFDNLQDLVVRVSTNENYIFHFHLVFADLFPEKSGRVALHTSFTNTPSWAKFDVPDHVVFGSRLILLKYSFKEQPSWPSSSWRQFKCIDGFGSTISYISVSSLRQFTVSPWTTCLPRINAQRCMKQLSSWKYLRFIDQDISIKFANESHQSIHARSAHSARQNQTFNKVCMVFFILRYHFLMNNCRKVYVLSHSMHSRFKLIILIVHNGTAELSTRRGKLHDPCPSFIKPGVIPVVESRIFAWRGTYGPEPCVKRIVRHPRQLTRGHVGETAVLGNYHH